MKGKVTRTDNMGNRAGLLGSQSGQLFAYLGCSGGWIDCCLSAGIEGTGISYSLKLYKYSQIERTFNVVMSCLLLLSQVLSIIQHYVASEL